MLVEYLQGILPHSAFFHLQNLGPLPARGLDYHGRPSNTLSRMFLVDGIVSIESSIVGSGPSGFFLEKRILPKENYPAHLIRWDAQQIRGETSKLFLSLYFSAGTEELVAQSGVIFDANETK